MSQNFNVCANSTQSKSIQTATIGRIFAEIQKWYLAVFKYRPIESNKASVCVFDSKSATLRTEIAQLLFPTKVDIFHNVCACVCVRRAGAIEMLQRLYGQRLHQYIEYEHKEGSTMYIVWVPNCTVSIATIKGKIKMLNVHWMSSICIHWWSTVCYMSNTNFIRIRPFRQQRSTEMIRIPLKQWIIDTGIFIFRVFGEYFAPPLIYVLL